MAINRGSTTTRERRILRRIGGTGSSEMCGHIFWELCTPVSEKKKNAAFIQDHILKTVTIENCEAVVHVGIYPPPHVLTAVLKPLFLSRCVTQVVAERRSDISLRATRQHEHCCLYHVLRHTTLYHV
jgi:hypothetical protein